MKAFAAVEFDPVECKRQLSELQELLARDEELFESQTLKPFFQSRAQLCLFLGIHCGIGIADRWATEFQIFGNFAADLVIGNFERKQYCAIELEEATENTVFHQRSSRATSDWGAKLEHGFGQLIDWFYSFDSYKNTPDFENIFGYGHIEFSGMLIAGRSHFVGAGDERRLRWRSGKVSINSHKIHCLTYDDLSESLLTQWNLLYQLSQKPN